MNIEKRNLIQAEASTAIVNARFHGILDLSPRFGKSKTTLLALEKIDKVINILITAPFNSILDGWKAEVNLWGCKHNITYVNDRSLSNVDWDSIHLVVKDEIHQISESQVDILKSSKKPIIGLTGSLSNDNKKYLKQTLGLLVKYTYSIEQAIEDRIISDFTVKVHYVELDNKIKNIEYGTKLKPLIGTELEVYTWASSQFERFKYMSYSNPALSNLKMKYAGVRTRIIYGSINKIKKSKSLLKTKNKVLVFTGLTKVADSITSNSHHSKSTGDSLEKFLNGEVNHLAVVNQLNMGFTDKKLKRIIVNQLQSKEENAIQRMMRAMNFEEGKEAVIDIILVKDTVDEDWFNKASSWIPKNKIKIMK
jgi:superfamily II DNA or RNA helicase